ncbi:MAG: VCBS repeat-containing protein, partial [Myxococcota bacterium]
MADRADPVLSASREPAPALHLGASPDSVLSAIERLESDHDARCHSSASRFEDFLFGTPLSAEARRANVELKKRLVRRLWSRASAVAAQAGDSTVRPHHLRRELGDVVAVERSADARVRVAFPGVPVLFIPELRATQYASIAYSLRAILAVAQDFMVSGGDLLLELAPESIDALRETLDVVALSALLLADRDAREESEFEITGSRLRAAWNRLLPDLGEDAPGGHSARSLEPPAPADARARSLALLDQIVDAKTSAYRAYNDLDGRDPIPLLVFNISRFYARRPLSPLRRDRRQLVSVFETRLDAFTADLLREADRRARAAGHGLIRAEDASAAVQQLVPHRIDEFEDVHVFHRLAGNDRVTLESFDGDSFRDFGIHWRSLQRAAHAAPPESTASDPFAAEILAEGVSQYGVLLLRVAGSAAGQDTESVRLLPGDLGKAASSIRDRARRHHAAPEPATLGSRIASARGEPGGPGGKAFFTDVTAAAAVDFTHRSSKWLGEFRHKQLKTPPTFSGGGVAAEDVDGDSDVDLLFVGGAGNALLLNDGHGRFSDVTQEAGIGLLRPDGSHGEARNPIIADFDNDGRQDILITYVDDDHRLYRNLGGLRFADVSSGSGLGGKGLVGGPATVFDFDGDGLLDVYVGYFGDYLHGGIPTVERDNQNALPNKLFRNLGGMRFVDVTEGSGTANTGWTQAVSHVDFDRDGRQDIIVANDYGRNAFLRNMGSGRFEDRAPALGVTKAYHSMNVGIADLNDDGHPDIYISNLATLVKDGKYSFPDVNTPVDFDLRAMARMLIKESDMLYMSRLEQGRLIAYAPSTDVERGSTSTGWAWDAEFLDFDHDGDDDLYLVNGTNDFNTFSMVYRRFNQDGTSNEYLFNHSRESNVFFLNDGGKLKNVSSRSGADFAGNSRSTAYLDLDDDGDLDIAVNNFHAKAVVLRNDS